MVELFVHPGTSGEGSEEMNGKNWLEANGKKVSEFGGNVADLLWECFGGIYHIRKEVMKADFSDEYFVKINIHDGRDIGTYDNSYLTDLVILAHKYNVKISIFAAAPHYLCLHFIKITTTGFFRPNHPTLDEFITKVNEARK
jgi:hypothetical protein